MLEHLIAATLSVLRLQPILGIILGVPLGIIVGAIPGLTATMAVGLLIWHGTGSRVFHVNGCLCWRDLRGLYFSYFIKNAGNTCFNRYLF